MGLYTYPHIWSTAKEFGSTARSSPKKPIAEHILDEVFDDALSSFRHLNHHGLCLFAREKVDYAVIEVGLGGRLDATNVITPILAIITSIGYDHTALFGNTLEEIAREKGGIVKPNVPLITGTLPFFPNAIQVAPQPFFELENRAITVEPSKNSASIPERGLEAMPPCRFRRVGTILFDVARDPPAFERLIEALQFHFPTGNFPFTSPFPKTKDWKRYIEIIKPYATTSPSSKATVHASVKNTPGFHTIQPQQIRRRDRHRQFFSFRKIRPENDMSAVNNNLSMEKQLINAQSESRENNPKTKHKLRKV